VQGKMLVNLMEGGENDSFETKNGKDESAEEKNISSNPEEGPCPGCRPLGEKPLS